ncbi:MAG TPA: tetratricopeptide repeat protein [Verrucomicrobiae bacterium]|nr:tetratricopeptide repeat protein [Verrucomicrobiae bacterium]
MVTKKNWFQNVVWLLLIAVAMWTVGCTPPGPRALLDGKRLLEEGKYPAAIERLKVATTLMATNALAWNYLGLAYHHGGVPARAIDAYEKALKINHDLVVTHYNLGCLLLEQNKLDGARNELTAFNLQQRNSLDGCLKLGIVELRLKDFGAAERSFGDALRVSPQNAEALNDLGVVQMEKNRPREAAGFFNEALKQQPNYGPALLNLAMVSQSSLNHKPLALQKYREYLALTPRAANWEKVNVAVQQLEEELNPPPRPATNKPVMAGTSVANNPVRIAAPAATNNTFKVEIASNAAKSVATVPMKTGVPNGPAIKPEVVQLSDGPSVKVAGNVTTSRKSPPPAAVEPVKGVEPTDLGVAATPDKHGFLQKFNPLNLFHHDPKLVATPKPMPPIGTLPGDSAKAVIMSTNSMSVSKSAALLARPGSVARYAYISPAKPAVGNRLEAQQLFAQGVQAQLDRRFKDAMTLYQAATKADPGFFEAQSNLGLAAYDQGEMPLSLLAYETALAINPGSFNARFNFALALRKANYIQDAALELERLLASCPPEESPAHLAMAHLTVANLYAEQFHQVASARSHYAKVLELDPQNSQATAIRYWLRDNP